LADFGISRRLPNGQTTLHTTSAGTKCWKAREILDVYVDVPCKMSADIQVCFVFRKKIGKCIKRNILLFIFMLFFFFMYIGGRDVDILHPIWRTSSIWRRLQM